MAKRKLETGLGRGLDALFGDPDLPAQGEGSVSLPISQVEPGLNQPRKRFDPESLADLAESIRLHGIIGKLKGWCEPMAFLFPLNVIGDLAFPVSLTLRLFGNMLGGTIIVTLLYMLVKAFMPFTALMYVVTPFLHMYFDIFTAFMQTYIFFTLASYFLGESCDREEV